MDKISTEVRDGLVTEMYADGDDLIVNYQQDAEPAFEQVQKLRNHGDLWAKGMAKDFVHAMHIPNGVVMELRGIGVNVYTAPLKEIVAGLRKLNRYDACKLTDKRLA